MKYEISFCIENEILRKTDLSYFEGGADGKVCETRVGCACEGTGAIPYGLLSCSIP